MREICLNVCRLDFKIETIANNSCLAQRSMRVLSYLVFQFEIKHYKWLQIDGYLHIVFCFVSVDALTSCKFTH